MRTLCLLLLLSFAVASSPLEDYQHWPSQGELKLLKIEQQQYVSLWLSEQSPQKRGTAILLPDWGLLPTSPDSIDALRLQLPEYGWETVALLPPQPSPESMLKDRNQASVEQFHSDIQHLLEQAIQAQEEQFGYQLIVAQGVMASWMLELYQQQKMKLPDGLVLINAYTPDSGFNQLLAEQLSQLPIPILDLYSPRYNQWSEAAATQRYQASYKAQKRDYRQSSFIARAELAPRSAELNKAVYGWLTSLGWY